MNLRRLIAVASAVLSFQSATAQAAVLHPIGRTALAGYSGDFDHFAVDLRGNRLFLAAEDHGTLEVFDLRSGKHLRTVSGVETPHALLYMADSKRLIVSDSGAGLTKILDAATLAPLGTIATAPGADSMGYDAQAGCVYLVTGGKNGNMAQSILVKVDAHTGRTLAEARFDTDKVEAMAIEQNGRLLYLNVTGKNEVAVLDKATLEVVKTWPIVAGQANAAMALDEAHARLFVVTRKPYQLLVLDTATGATVAALPAPQRTNEVIFDRDNQRVYLAGDDVIGVVRQRDPEHYEALAPVASAKGAKTAILVPQRRRLFAAVSPGEGKTGAALIWFDVAPASPAAK